MGKNKEAPHRIKTRRGAPMGQKENERENEGENVL